LDEEDIENIRKICTYGSIKANPKSIKLVKTGVANIDDDKILFNSPFAYNIAIEWLYKSDIRINAPFVTLSDLIMNVFSLVPLKLMLDPGSVGSEGELSESFWQKVFYKLITAIMPAETFLCNEVQYLSDFSVIDSLRLLGESKTTLTGKIDFYLNTNYQWAIELLINGYKNLTVKKKNKPDVTMTKLEEHYTRLKEGGQYYHLVENQICKDYLVIDISSNLIHKYGDLTQRNEKFANCWIVIYTIYEKDIFKDNETGEEVINHYQAEKPKFDIYKYNNDGDPEHTEIPIKPDFLL
jgi:hypothetical protein